MSDQIVQYKLVKQELKVSDVYFCSFFIAAMIILAVWIIEDSNIWLIPLIVTGISMYFAAKNEGKFFDYKKIPITRKEAKHG